MKIAMIGSGYVGLTTGTCFAELGHKVICVDNNAEKIELLNSGKIPIFEPGLEKLVKKNTQKKSLSFTTDISFAVKESEVVFIAVGTPPKENGEADLSFVENVSKEIANAITKYTVVVEKSTVPVETGEKVAKTIENAGIKKELFDIVSNPEFLREGNAIEDFMKPDRIVIGVNSNKAKEIMQKLYAPINSPIIFTSIKSAEIIKHASNSFLATKISFINSVSRICELSGANIDEVSAGMGLDKRIGKSFLNAGIGYGGFCFPKDADAFIKISEKLGYDFKILKEAQNVNSNQKTHFIKKIHESLSGVFGKKIGVWGLAFKPNTDDMRFAPSIDILSELKKYGAKLYAFDPQAQNNAKKILPGINFCTDLFEAAKGADALLILTEWDEFKKTDLKKLKSVLKNPVIIDGRNIFDPKKMAENGFNYVSIGR